MDFKYDKIYNGWILFGILIGLSFRVRESGWQGMYYAIAAMFLSFCLFYPIFKIGGLGAGDVKLFMMVGSFLSVKRFLNVAVISFIIGAVFSLGKMISEKNFKEQICSLFTYLLEVSHTRQWKVYGENLEKSVSKYKSNKIHFALPICISVMLELGGVF